jgi:hypothetical protein
MNSLENIYDKIAEINYLSIEYDYIVIEPIYENIIKSIFMTPTITTNIDFENMTFIDLSEFSILQNIKSSFEFAPIRYVCSGYLGDFLHSISVINENFYKTGKKGVLYIANEMGGGTFKNGLENTYKDTYEIIYSQRYIHKYEIYNNNEFDINLNDWYKSELLYKTNWYHIYKEKYNVEWAVHPWIKAPYDARWKDRVVINMMNYRKSVNIDYRKLYQQYGDSLLFISFDMDSYTDFVQFTGLSIEYYKPINFTDACIVINSCKLFVATLSALLCVGHGIHKERIIGLCTEYGDNVHNMNLESIWPNISYSV